MFKKLLIVLFACTMLLQPIQVLALESGEAKQSEVSKVGKIEEIDCETFPKTLAWLKKAFTFIKVLGPILVLGLGTVDYAKAIFSGEDDILKKTNKRFIKRIIAACCIFIVPVIIEFFFSLSNKFSGDMFCGIK